MKVRINASLAASLIILFSIISCNKINVSDEVNFNRTSTNTEPIVLLGSNQIRVISFNVLSPCWAHPSYYPASSALLLNRVSRRDAIINFLKSNQSSVDVIALQEVAQVEFNYFKDALKQTYVGFQANHDPNYWSSWITVNPAWELNGNAIFVKKDIFSNVVFRDFPASLSGNHAALFTGSIKNAVGKNVRIASVHLDSDYPYNRNRELNAVLDLWPAASNTVDIIAGDFNTESDATNIQADIRRANYYDVLEVLGAAKQTHPWDSKYYGADNWGIIDHIISRNTSPLDGRVNDFNLFQLYPNNEEMRINKNLQLSGSDHFPIIGTVRY